MASANKETLKSYVPKIMDRLVVILSSKKLNKSLARNIAITLGRLGLLAPEDVAKFLGKIMKQWCVSLRYLKTNNDEKHQAYKGLCYTVSKNTSALKSNFAYFCSVAVNYKDPREELERIFKSILEVFRQ
mmetsp:Transcript_34194/g.52467  ORF Transcript_34194/g.52467 Transcript_34194/m.52467 type:complete len:130 (+) Transcript_34194:280-669(+)